LSDSCVRLAQNARGPEGAGHTEKFWQCVGRSLSQGLPPFPFSLPQTRAPGDPRHQKSEWPRKPWKPCNWRSGSVSSHTLAGWAAEVGLAASLAWVALSCLPARDQAVPYLYRLLESPQLTHSFLLFYSFLLHSFIHSFILHSPSCLFTHPLTVLQTCI
jgi:hypothetical protein